MNLIYNSNLKNVIGNKSGLLYNISEDMKFFTQITNISDKKNILIVGRKTFETLPIDLMLKSGNRTFWVITNSINLVDSEFINFMTYEHAKKMYEENKNNSEYNWCLIGGKQIYELFECYVKRICHCKVMDDFIDDNCITYKPKCIDNYRMLKVVYCYGRKNRLNGDKVDVEFKTYLKIANKFDKKNVDTVDNDHIAILNDDNKNINHKIVTIDVNHLEISLNDAKENNKNIDHPENQYLNILKKTLNGTKRMTRNGYTYSYFGDMIRFDLSQGFPLLTTKKMFFKGILHELLFFIRGETDTKILEDKGVNIWKGNTSREFLDSVGLNSYDDGEMGPMYGYQWRKFNGKIDQLSNLLIEMENNPTSRRLLMTVFNPEQVHLGVLYPCHSIVTQFYLNEINDNTYEVSVNMYQRSADVFLGLPFNIASSALFLEIICHYLNNKQNIKKYIPKDIIISLGDVHLYDSHITQALEQISRQPFQFCNLMIKNTYNKIDDYKYEDFEIINYNSHSTIKANMVA
jgi:thymidylate synthase